MTLPALEAAALYAIGVVQAGAVFTLGCVYHDVSALTLGAILIAYALGRAVKAAKLWWAT